MADNNERSRSDELFDILNAVHDEADSKSIPLSEPVTETSLADQEPSQPQNQEENISLPQGVSLDSILQMLSEENKNKESYSVSDISDGDDDVKIFSPESTETQTSDDNEEESNFPTSFFGHLSDEGGSEQEIVSNPLFDTNSHFTEEIPVVPEAEEKAEENEGEDDEDEEYESNASVKAVGRFFRGMSFIPKAIIYILLIFIASAYLSYYIITIGNDVFALVTDSRQVTVNIPEGATDEDVAKILKDNGIIEYDWVYELYMKYRGDGDEDTEYIAGEHTLDKDFNYAQIIISLTTGSLEREVVRVTIPEGYTINQIIDLLVEKGVGQRDDYIEAINNYPYKWDFVQQLEEIGYSEDRMYRLEGYLYPDTYDFYTNEDEVYVINKMLNAFNDRFWRDFIKKDKEGNSVQTMMLEQYGMTFDDIVVLASVVQSEGGTPEDFYYVSYVFHNRLSHPQTFPKLESDATIQYVLPERVDSTELDVSLETPYNSYLYDGLPPGAISNPGSDALFAVLSPEAPKNDRGHEIDAYYFVANNAGKTYYAHDVSGHEQNKLRAKEDNEAIEAGTYEG